MWRKLFRFLTYEPHPDESLVMRIGMRLCGMGFMVVGIFTAIRMIAGEVPWHWWPFASIPWGIIFLWASFQTRRPGS
jgi:hypothetical protein